MTSEARSNDRTVLAMAAMAGLATLALFGGVDAALVQDLIKAFLPSAPAGAIEEVATWVLNEFLLSGL